MASASRVGESVRFRFDLVANDPVCGDLILRAFIIRRSILIGLRTGLRILGSRHSPDTRRLRVRTCDEDGRTEDQPEDEECQPSQKSTFTPKFVHA